LGAKLQKRVQNLPAGIAMKVLLVTPYFFPKIGGVERHTYNIAKGLAQKGHDVLVVTTLDSPERLRTEELDGFRVIRLPILLKVSMTPFHPLWYFWLKDIIKTEKPDVIEAHSPVPGLADIAFLAKGKTKFVIKYHSGSLKKGKSTILDALLVAYEQVILKHILKKSDAIMAVYPQFLESLIGKQDKIKFIPPGVDTKLFRPKPDIKKTTDVLYVGRIEHASAWKGIDVLLKSIVILAKDKPDISLSIVGSGDAVDHFKKVASDLDIAKNVAFVGSLSGETLVDQYNAARLLVLPSTTEAESFGNVLIEAMACGVPVIGSRVGGIPNVINEAQGTLVAPNDVQELADAIRQILKSKDRSITGVGKNKVSEIFSVDNLINKTDQLLKQTVSIK
jgi:glycosyltransferase involved in cell wall biosynthesis